MVTPKILALGRLEAEGLSGVQDKSGLRGELQDYMDNRTNPVSRQPNKKANKLPEGFHNAEEPWPNVTCPRALIGHGLLYFVCLFS